MATIASMTAALRADTSNFEQKMLKSAKTGKAFGSTITAPMRTATDAMLAAEASVVRLSDAFRRGHISVKQYEAGVHQAKNAVVSFEAAAKRARFDEIMAPLGGLGRGRGRGGKFNANRALLDTGYDFAGESFLRSGGGAGAAAGRGFGRSLTGSIVGNQAANLLGRYTGMPVSALGKMGPAGLGAAGFAAGYAAPKLAADALKKSGLLDEKTNQELGDLSEAWMSGVKAVTKPLAKLAAGIVLAPSRIAKWLAGVDENAVALKETKKWVDRHSGFNARMKPIEDREDALLALDKKALASGVSTQTLGAADWQNRFDERIKTASIAHQKGDEVGAAEHTMAAARMQREREESVKRMIAFEERHKQLVTEIGGSLEEQANLRSRMVEGVSQEVAALELVGATQEEIAKVMRDQAALKTSEQLLKIKEWTEDTQLAAERMAADFAGATSKTAELAQILKGVQGGISPAGEAILKEAEAAKEAYEYEARRKELREAEVALAKDLDELSNSIYESAVRAAEADADRLLKNKELLQKWKDFGATPGAAAAGQFKQSSNDILNAVALGLPLADARAALDKLKTDARQSLGGEREARLPAALVRGSAEFAAAANRARTPAHVKNPQLEKQIGIAEKQLTQLERIQRAVAGNVAEIEAAPFP